MIRIYIYDKAYIDKQSASETICGLASLYASDFNIKGIFDTISYGDKGKPFFNNSPNLHFSISHSGCYWVCALSSSCIGIDLQEIRPCSYLPLAKRFFHPDEYSLLASLGEPEDCSSNLANSENSVANEFFNIWTSKESYVKYTGTGISDNFTNFSVLSPDKLSIAFNLIPFDPDYKLCICAKSPLAVELIRV